MSYGPYEWKIYTHRTVREIDVYPAEEGYTTETTEIDRVQWLRLFDPSGEITSYRISQSDADNLIAATPELAQAWIDGLLTAVFSPERASVS